MLELQCTESLFRASKNTKLCLVQLSKWRESKARMLKSFFLSERKVLNAILRLKLKYMKDVFFMKWNVICNAEDRFHVLELFCRASHVRASMHRITSLELLRTLKLCLMQLRKWRECKATDAEKLSQWEKVAKCNFKSNAQVHERCFFLMKWNVIAMQKTDFHV